MKVARTNGHRRGRSRNSLETFVERVWLVPAPHLGRSILIGSLPFLQGCRLVIIAATLAIGESHKIAAEPYVIEEICCWAVSVGIT